MFETILKRFQQLGILDKVVIIGSWAAFLYRNYFFSKTYGFVPKTTDVDFLVPLPCKIDKPIDLPEELKRLFLLKARYYYINHSSENYFSQ